MSEKILIKYHEKIDPIEQAHQGEWFDLRAAEDVFIPVGTYKMISLGVSIKLPEGHEAHVVPRSSTFKNFGIIMTNSIGIIDETYCGEDDIWRFPAYCLESREVVNGCAGTMIHKNDRICQFRIVKNQGIVEVETVDKMDSPNRGGIGSTGVK